MALNISEYPISQSIVRPALTLQNSTMNQIYTEEQINTPRYTTPILKPAQVLPIEILPWKVLENNQQLNDTNYAQAFPISGYNNTGNNLNINSNTNTVAQNNKYYNMTTTPISNISYINQGNKSNIYQNVTTTPITNISDTNEGYNLNNNQTLTTTPITNISYTNEVYNTNNYQTLTTTPEYITPVSQTSNINYTAEEYPINNYPTQIEEQNYNYGTMQTGENIEYNNYSLNEYVDSNQNGNIITNNENYQVDYNQNREYTINSNDNQYMPQENYANSYIHQSPLITNKFDIFPDINSSFPNFQTMSYNQENIVYRLEDDAFQQNLGNSEERVLEEQAGQLSPFTEQLTENTTLNAQFAEIDELKKKVKELKGLKAQLEQKKYKKKKKIKSFGNKVGKLNKKHEKKVIRNKKVKSMKELENNTNKNLEEKKEQAFVNGDIIHNNEELEMLARKINKSSQKMTLNLIYKATVDSDRAEEFHKKCDKAKSTLVLIETDKGKRFGGYTSKNWEGNCIDKLDEEAFVFSLDKMKIYENIKGENAIGCYPKYGPVFLGCQIRIYDNAFQRGGTTFEKGLNFNTKEDFELTDGEKEFKVKDIEVYEIIVH